MVLKPTITHQLDLTPMITGLHQALKSGALQDTLVAEITNGKQGKQVTVVYTKESKTYVIHWIIRPTRVSIPATRDGVKVMVKITSGASTGWILLMIAAVMLPQPCLSACLGMSFHTAVSSDCFRTWAFTQCLDLSMTSKRRQSAMLLAMMTLCAAT